MQNNHKLKQKCAKALQDTAIKTGNDHIYRYFCALMTRASSHTPSNDNKLQRVKNINYKQYYPLNCGE